MAELTARQKAAAVLLCVDSEAAAAVLKNLPEEDVAAVTREMHSLGNLEPQEAVSVLCEFSARASTEQSIEATPKLLRERLEMAVGHDGARRLLQELGVDDTAEQLFRPLREIDAAELAKLLLDEHPQTVSLVLSNLEPKQTAMVMAHFPPELQVDVVRRMTKSQQADENMLKRVGEILKNKLGMLGEVRKAPEDPRYKRVAEVINLLGQSAEEQILKELSAESPEMVKKIREMMFVFEDILNLSDGDVRKVLMSIDTQLLAMALKTASEPLKEKIFANLSRRATETVTEEMELLGPKPLSQVKAAQQQIVETIRKMDAAGEISIRGNKYEEDPLV